MKALSFASQLLIDICLRERIAPNTLTVHSDNGSPMKGHTMLSTMQALGVAPSRSRPSVSNDNPYAESLFRTLKYRPDLPTQAFADLLAARRWVTDLVHWYNHEHRHSSISFVTPEQRHAHQDQNILHQRRQVFEKAKAKNPNRWSAPTRSWTYHQSVHLNPDSTPKHETLITQKAA
jgi:putative transposase